MAKDQNKNATTLRFNALKWIYQHLIFVCFLMLLGVLYIANVHSVEKKLRKAQLLKAEIKELNYSYMNIKSDIVQQSTRTKVAQRVKRSGLKSDGRDLNKISVREGNATTDE